MITEYFQTNHQEVKMISEKKEQVIYPKIFKLETGRDLLISLQEMVKKENKAGYILSVVGDLSKARIQCPGKNNQL